MSTKDQHSLETILKAISKINRYSKEFSDHDNFYKDDKAFDAVLMNFIVIGEMVLRISDSTKEATPHIDWNRIKGFSNLVTHDYFGIDAEEVWQIILNDLPQLFTDISNIN